MVHKIIDRYEDIDDGPEGIDVQYLWTLFVNYMDAKKEYLNSKKEWEKYNNKRWDVQDKMNKLNLLEYPTISTFKKYKKLLDKRNNIQRPPPELTDSDVQKCEEELFKFFDVDIEDDNG